jgi:hypothetical protein
VESEDRTIKKKVVQLSEWGQKLPIGFPTPEGEPARDINFRPWRMKEERELGAVRDKERNMNVAKFVGVVLGKMCVQLGPHNFDTMKEIERRVIVGQMFMADVYQAYLWLRMVAMGSEIDIDVTCPFCRHGFLFKADLQTVEVHVPESMDDAKWEYELNDPFEVRGNKVERLTMGPARWNCLENVHSGEFNTGEAKSALIHGSIHAVPGFDNVMLSVNELDEMTKRDIEGLTGGIEEHRLGPDMSIEGNCPSCSREFVTALDWGFDGFFGTSSRSRKQA